MSAAEWIQAFVVGMWSFVVDYAWLLFTVIATIIGGGFVFGRKMDREIDGLEEHRGSADRG
jgi:hypothetical protein